MAAQHRLWCSAGVAPVGRVMQPGDIGDMVLHAVQNDRFYILSHEEFQVPVKKERKSWQMSLPTGRAMRRKQC